MRRLKIPTLLATALALVGWDTLGAQNLTGPLDSTPARPIEGSSGGLRLGDLNNLPSSQFSSPSDSLLGAIKVHKDPLGKPCVSVSAFAKKETNFREIFEKSQSSQSSPDSNSTSDQAATKLNVYTHMVTAKNNCAQTIKLNLCYYGSQSCVPVSVPGYGRQDAVLGIYPGLTDFRYQYTEQF